MDLELATIEDIMAELTRRDLYAVLVVSHPFDDQDIRMEIAPTSNLGRDTTRSLLWHGLEKWKREAPETPPE